jgi:hypothetical protein
VLDQAVVNGIKSKFQAVGDSQLVEDIVQMIFERLVANEEFFRDLFVPITLRYQLAALLCL